LIEEKEVLIQKGKEEEGIKNDFNSRVFSSF